MSIQSLKKKLDKVLLPPPPLSYSEMPVEEWVAQELRDPITEAHLKNITDEEYFYDWLEDLPIGITFGIGPKVMWARNELWTVTDPVPLLPEEISRRVVDVLPYWIESNRRRWIDDFPYREQRRKMVSKAEAEHGKVKTRENGYGWWFELQEDYARLAKKYSGWEQEWAGFYVEWEKQCVSSGKISSMSEHIRDTLFSVMCAQGDQEHAAMADEHMREIFLCIMFARYGQEQPKAITVQ